MTSFRVHTDRLVAHANTLGGLGGEMGVTGQMISHAGNAAAETTAAGALTQATAAWVRVLAHYGDVTQALGTAVAMAAQCYSVTDDSVVPSG